jgi:hypothetical protein
MRSKLKLSFLTMITAVSIVCDYRVDNWGSIPDTGRGIFSLTSASRTALGCTQHPVQWVLEGSFPGGKVRLKRDTDHSPPSSAEVKKE